MTVPQLDPKPWLTILLLSWMVFLLIIAPKILPLSFPNDPGALTAHALTLDPWTWPLS